MDISWLKTIEQSIDEWATLTFPGLVQHCFDQNTKFKIQAKLPADSELHFRPYKKGLIAVSKSYGIVLKIFLDPLDKGRLEKEILNLKSFQDSEFSPHAPKYLADGVSSQGARWVMTDICLDPSLENNSRAEDILLKELFAKTLPAMEKLYRSQHPLVENYAVWLERAKARTESHPSKDKLRKFILLIEEEANKFPEYKVVTSSVHHDLHLGNILFSDQGHVTVIDWEGMIRALILVDVLDFFRRYLTKHRFKLFLFWQFMADRMKAPPQIIADAYEKYRLWAKATFGIEVPAGSIKLSFMIFILERCLNSFEGRGVDRLTARSGFETKLFKSMGIK